MIPVNTQISSHTLHRPAAPSSSEGPIRLRVDKLQIGYQNQAILPPLSWTLRASEIWALFGPNGGGKSTLLHTLLQLTPAIDGRIDARQTRWSAVPQRQSMERLAPQRVIDVISGGVGRRWDFLRPWTSAAHASRIAQAAEDTQTTPLLHHPYHALSEGQKQRVLIARALASEPNLLTLDEPTSAMDPFHQEAIFALLEQIAQTRALAIVVASHQMDALLECATHAIYVNRHHHIALSGTLHTVLEHSAVRAQYGDLAARLPRARRSNDAPHPS